MLPVNSIHARAPRYGHRDEHCHKPHCYQIAYVVRGRYLTLVDGNNGPMEWYEHSA